jgi:hypothetical protein
MIKRADRGFCLKTKIVIQEYVIHSGYGMRAETCDNTGIMVHMITGTIDAIMRSHTSRIFGHMVQVHSRTR